MNEMSRGVINSGTISSSTMSESAIIEAQKAFLSKVYAWMLSGLLITGFTAMFAMDWGIVQSIMNSPLAFVLIIAQFGLVIALSGWIEKMSVQTAALSFLVYSFLTGLTFSVIFLMYTSESISNTFFVTAGAFGALSLYGFVTKKSLSGMGSFLFMGLFGIIFASIANLFIASSALNFTITIIGVLVFAGLTAYDTQKIKEMYVLQAQGDDAATKGAIMGALRLYLDLINLFLMLLRLLGGSRN